MNQQQALQLFLPILILLPVLYFRLRKMSRPQPLKLKLLWIRPAVILIAAGLVLWAPGQQAARHLTPQDWMILALMGAVGAVAGWYWGRTMKIEIHPEDGTLMVRGGQAAVLVLVVLILFRTGLRTGMEVEGQAWHLDVLLLSDASIVFTALLFTVRSIEMYIRARAVMAARKPVV
jgi:hypothetical protein